MKEHFCPAEQSTIAYQGKCNWCGESEGSMTQEVLKLAEDYAKNRANYHIESLYGRSESYTATIKKAMLKAHQALKEALAQTQEPVAWLSTDSIGERHLCFDKPLDNDPVQPLYTTPPQRTWVGLTKKEILLVNEKQDESIIAAPDDELIQFARAIEAKLKEKNNGV